MTIKIPFASLSFGASVDQQTGSLSVFDVLEEIRSQQLPINIPALVLAVLFENPSKIEQSGKLFIHLITPDGKQQMVGSGDMKIPQEQTRMKAVFRLNGFPIHQFGSHRFVLSCVDQSATKIAESILDFDVIQVPMSH